MAIEKVVAKTINKVSFEVDSKSWKAIDKFQKRIGQIKKQMSSMNTTIKVKANAAANAQVKAIERVEKAKKRMSSAYESIRSGGSVIKDYPKPPENKASKTTLANQLRMEEAESKRKEAAAKQRRQTLANEDRMMEKLNMQRAKLSNEQRTSALLQIRKLNKELLSGTIKADQYRHSLDKINRTVTRQANSYKSLFDRMKSVRTLMVGGLAVGAMAGIRDVVQTGQRFESLTAGLMMTAGGLKEARKEMAWVSNVATELGANLEFATEGYMKMAVAGKANMGNEQLKELFRGFTEYATATGTSSFRYEKSIMAISQMLNKNQIMAEELKSQLSESLPGALQVFARALGVSEKKLFKMMERGELIASEVLPKVAKEFAKSAKAGGALDMMLETNEKSMTRMKNAFLDFKNTFFFTQFNSALVSLYGLATDLMTVFTPLMKMLGNFLGGVIDVFLVPLRVVFGSLAWIMERLGYLLPDWLRESSGTMTYLLGLAGGVMLLTKSFIALATALGVISSLKFLPVLLGFLLNPATLAALVALAAIGGVGYMAYNSLPNTAMTSKSTRSTAYNKSVADKNATARIDLTLNKEKLDGFVDAKVADAINIETSDMNSVATS